MTVTTSSLPAPVQQSFGYKLLSVPVPNLIHKIPAFQDKMPQNGGNTLRRRRYNPLNTATVPLGNSGIYPPPQQLTAVDIDCKMSFYGTYITLNEQVTLQAQDPVLNEGTKRLGVSLRQTEDELTRNMLASTASFLNCVGGTNGDNPSELARSDVDDVIKTLAGADAYCLSDMIEGDDKFGTAPVRDSYFVMASTDLIGDLERVDGFKSKANYAFQENVPRPEWGNISNTRWLLSSVGSKTANDSMNGADVYNCFVAGMEAYSCVEQDGYSAQFIYRPPIYDGPLALNASIGYKFAEVPCITNDAWIINLRCTLSV